MLLNNYNAGLVYYYMLLCYYYNPGLAAAAAVPWRHHGLRESEKGPGVDMWESWVVAIPLFEMLQFDILAKS